ncbi:MAG TPA: hypothetical protein VFW23_02450 [Tepidisphaeraceae bacterium]|nr:hypothetical protein [Tepidisphaeraceae bacterium]
MLRLIAASLSILLIAGCASDNSSSSNAGATGPTDTERAAYAASAHFPTEAPISSEIAAVSRPSENAVKLYNFSTRPLRNVNVWINQAFVTHLSGIPARGSVTLNTANFYNALGSSLTKENQGIRQIVINSDEGVYSVMGPLSE